MRIGDWSSDVCSSDLAKVLAPHGVTINTMLPVMHHTPGIRAFYEAQAQARGTSYDIEVARLVKEAPIPAGRFGDAGDFGTLVALFSSEERRVGKACVRRCRSRGWPYP